MIETLLTLFLTATVMLRILRVSGWVMLKIAGDAGVMRGTLTVTFTGGVAGIVVVVVGSVVVVVVAVMFDVELGVVVVVVGVETVVEKDRLPNHVLAVPFIVE
jgi:hypothetical protein